MVDSPSEGRPLGPSDDDDIEILEIVGLEEGEEAADRSEEIEVLFEDEAKPRRAGADAPQAATAPREVLEREQHLRLRADFENLRKRLEREQEEFARLATRDLVLRLLVVLDNFERALAAGRESGGNGAFREGVALIHRQLYEELCREGLAAVDAVGETFDPAIHEAVATDSTSALPANTIVEELRRGYYFQGRLIRPALVRVSVPSDSSGSRKER